MVKSLLLFVSLAFTCIAPSPNAQNPVQGAMAQTEDAPITVLVHYKAQTGKEDVALEAITHLVKKAATEPYYINITICVDPVDPANILLYERWESEAYYKGDHGNTVHLQEFIGSAMAFLAGPPEISFWKVRRW
jgi:quinol monooxygenase YgiN